MTRPTGMPVFERFFRSVASIQIDKSDVRRFRDFVEQTGTDLREVAFARIIGVTTTVSVPSPAGAPRRG